MGKLININSKKIIYGMIVCLIFCFTLCFVCSNKAFAQGEGQYQIGGSTSPHKDGSEKYNWFDINKSPYVVDKNSNIWNQDIWTVNMSRSLQCNEAYIDEYDKANYVDNVILFADINSGIFGVAAGVHSEWGMFRDVAFRYTIVLVSADGQVIETLPLEDAASIDYDCWTTTGFCDKIPDVLDNGGKLVIKDIEVFDSYVDM